MKRAIPKQLRQDVNTALSNGEPVVDVAKRFGVSMAVVYGWRRELFASNRMNSRLEEIERLLIEQNALLQRVLHA